jgi:hypothetical protein
VLTVVLALFFATAAACVTGISLLFPHSALNWIWELNRPAYVAFARLGRLPGLLLLALGTLCGAMAFGLLQRRRWAWWGAIVLFGIHCVGDLVTLVLYRDLVKGSSGIVIASLFLLCLLMPGTRRYFAVPHAGR